MARRYSIKKTKAEVEEETEVQECYVSALENPSQHGEAIDVSISLSKLRVSFWFVEHIYHDSTSGRCGPLPRFQHLSTW